MRKISEIPRSSIIILIFGFVFFSTIGIYLSKFMFEDENIQIAPLFLVLLFFFFGCFSLIALFTVKNFKLNEEGIEIISRKNKEIIPFVKIKYFKERKQLKGKYSIVGKFIKIYTEFGRYTIESVACNNYEDIVKALIDHGIPKYEFQTGMKVKIVSTIFLIVFYLSISLSVYISYKNPTMIDANELIEITGKLKEYPEDINPSKGSSSVILRFEQYPQYKFSVIADDIIRYNGFLSIQKGDSLIISIKKREFEIKIKKTLKPTFWEKHLNWFKISTYTIKNNQMVFLSLDQFNRYEIEDSKSAPFSILLINAFLIVSLIGIWWKKR